MKDINLLNDEFTSSAKNKKKKKSMVGSLVLILPILLILVALFSAPHVYNKILTSRLEKLQEQIDSPKFAELKRVRSDILNQESIKKDRENIIKVADIDNFSFDEIYRNLRGLIPQGCDLTAVKVEEGLVSFSGVVDENHKRSVIINNIYSNDFFKFTERTPDLKYNDANTFEFAIKLSQYNRGGE